MNRYIRVTLLLLLLGVGIIGNAALGSAQDHSAYGYPMHINWQSNIQLYYRYCLLPNPHHLVGDLQQMQFAGASYLTAAAAALVKCYYRSWSSNRWYTGWIGKLQQLVNVTVVTRTLGQRQLLSAISQPPETTKTTTPTQPKKLASQPPPLKPTLKKTARQKIHSKIQKKNHSKIIVAIDAGHGGKDPGAIGQAGLQEKQVNLAIAQRLAMLLQRDRQFFPVLTRSDDTFVAVGERSAIAREQHAQLLISIHADGALNAQARGASVWVLSNQRANDALVCWLSPNQQRVQLIGGVGSLLAQKRDRYVHYTVLDLQFSHSQQVGYQVASTVLRELAHVSSLHKREPEYASFGVLQSPDIPSLLVESGFITHAGEERLLRSAAYQQKIATAIYRGIKQYFQAHPPANTIRIVQTKPSLSTTASSRGRAVVVAATTPSVHVVRPRETLSAIAARYQISVAQLQQLNRLSSDRLRHGQKLRLPWPTEMSK